MKKRKSVFGVLGILSLLLCSCSSDKKMDTNPSGSSQPETEATASPVLEVGPEDDFYAYVNQDMLLGKQIPEDKAGWSFFYELENQAYENLNEILLTLVENRNQYGQESNEWKIAELYENALNMDKRNQAGLGALSVYLNEIQDATTVQEYVEALGQVGGQIDNRSLLSVSGTNSFEDSDTYILGLFAPDLGIGKEYLESQELGEVREKYRLYISNILELSGMENERAVALSGRILEFQKDLASSCLSVEDRGNPLKINHVYTLEQMNSELFTNVDMKPVLEKWGYGSFDRIMVTEVEAAKKINSYLVPENLELLKTYSTYVLIHDYAKYLSQDIRDHYLFFQQYLKGTEKISPDEKLAGQMVQELAAFEFGKMYVDRYFDEVSKQNAEELIKEILQMYGKRIDSLDWMSDSTKKMAKKKLETMRIKVGYPETWPDYLSRASIAPEEGILIDNVLEVMKSLAAYNREIYQKPVDPNEWGMTPQTVNAYYNPSGNEIVFPAAILQAPFYDENAEEAANLGGIGTVIAHEITHAFDNNGAQYDENGNYHPDMWWTPEDYQKFVELSNRIVIYYNGQESFEDHYVNGSLTLGENIADLGALSCVTALAKEKGLDLKILFYQYAAIWASKFTPENRLQRYNTDVHAPAEVRVNAVLKTLQPFYEAFPVKEGDGMYLKPEDRVKIW